MTIFCYTDYIMHKILLMLIGVIAIVGVFRYAPGGFSVSDLSSLPGRVFQQGQQFWKDLPHDPETRKEYVTTTLLSALKQASQTVSALFGSSASNSALHLGMATSTGSLLESIPYSDQVIHGFDVFWNAAGTYAERAWLYIIHTGFPNAIPTPAKKHTK